jgi:hypothetical protein
MTNTDVDTFIKQIALMIDNLEKQPRLGDVNLVFEGGSLNGYYLVGVAMFLKELERRGAMRVAKVSGTSIGAYIGFHYLNDTLGDAYKHSIHAKQSFVERLNMSYFKEAVAADVSGVAVAKLNGRLFVSYYEVIPERKRVVQSEFADVSDLRDALCASAYLPVLMDGGMTYVCNGGNRKRIDGGLPFLFDDKEKTLYVKLSGWNKIGNMFNHRGEKNGRGRVCEGIVSAYNFFLYGETGSDMCSWVANWGTFDRVVYGLKHVFCLIVSLIVCGMALGWRWFLSNNPGYDAIVDGLLSDADLSILITIWVKISDILKDMLIVLMK